MISASSPNPMEALWLLSLLDPLAFWGQTVLFSEPNIALVGEAFSHFQGRSELGTNDKERS